MENEHKLEGLQIFVVEDEALVSMLIEDMLADLKCEIAGRASRFDDAMTKAGDLVFDIAILDVNLNARQTFPIADALQERGTPFIFSTGYAAEGLPERFQSTPMLQKPFQLGDLKRALLRVRPRRASDTVAP